MKDQKLKTKIESIKNELIKADQLIYFEFTGVELKIDSIDEEILGIIDANPWYFNLSWGFDDVLKVFNRFPNTDWAGKLFERALNEGPEKIISLKKSKAIHFLNSEALQLILLHDSIVSELGNEKDPLVLLRLCAELIRIGGALNYHLLCSLLIWQVVYKDLGEKYKHRGFGQIDKVQGYDFITIDEGGEELYKSLIAEFNLRKRLPIHEEIEGGMTGIEDVLMIFVLAVSPLEIQEDGKYYFLNHHLAYSETPWSGPHPRWIKCDDNDDYSSGYEFDDGLCPLCSADPCQCSHPLWAD